MIGPVIFAVVLLLAFYLFLTAEFMLPTGGSMGLAAVVAIVSSVSVAFSHSVWLGSSITGTAVVLTPIVLSGLAKAWPHTPIGRRILNRRPGQIDASVPQKVTRGGVVVSELLGQHGVAKTDLLPSGLVLIAGQKLDAVSLGMPIEKGSPIEVVKVESNRIQVAPLDTDSIAVDEDRVSAGSPAALEQAFDLLDE